MLKNTDNTYGLIARMFHWLIAIAIISLLIVGFNMTGMAQSPEKFELYGMHKASGMIVLTLVIMRILWRFSNKIVQLPADLPYAMKLGARAGHFLLYVFMLAMPISGAMMSLFSGFDIAIFNFFTIPAFEKNLGLAKFFHTLHGTVAWCFVVVIVLHICAAFYHHFIRKDNVLMRIIKQT
ncbi:MAG: cytochrome b [Rickettsiaceae bacterium]